MAIFCLCRNIISSCSENFTVHKLSRILSLVNGNDNNSCISHHATRSYALKSSLPIKWVRPVKVPCHLPAKSGDLDLLKKLETKQLTPLEFNDSIELETAPEEVKRLFTLEYFPYKKTVEYLRHDYVAIVKRHKLDYDSPEARVARMTVDIRDLQNYMEKNPQNKKAKVRLKEIIDKRKKLLKFIRTWDYKKFEWLLEKLNLIYKPQPLRETYLRVERKRSLRMLTKNYCDDIINSRLRDYKKSLENEQEKFLEEKVQKLEWMVKEELECGVEPTVTEDDIQNAKSQLHNWRQKFRVHLKQ